MQIEQINDLLQKIPSRERGQVTDGYHTFSELYEHRIELFITLCRCIETFSYLTAKVWRSKRHSDGSEIDGYFILGIGDEPGHQISYHLPLSKWDECSFAYILETAPYWDGHDSKDVLDRLKGIPSRFKYS